MKYSGKSLFLLIILSLLSINILAQKNPTNGFYYCKQTHKGLTIPYRLFIPKNYDSKIKYPVILVLHGADARGTDNDAQITSTTIATYWADSSKQEKHPCFIIAPQCPTRVLWYGSSPFSKSPMNITLETVNNIIDTLNTKYSIDLNRLYVLGFSMGGVASWELITRFPRRYAAAVPMASYMDDYVDLDSLRSAPIWIFHGKKDDVFSVSFLYTYVSRLMNMGRSVVFPQCRFGVYSAQACWSSTALKDTINKGATLLFTEYPYDGHLDNVMLKAYKDTLLAMWLFKQHQPITTSVEDGHSTVPDNFCLYQNYPNPFNPETKIMYNLSSECYVTLKVYDNLGNEVTTLVDGIKPAGSYNSTFSAENSTLSSGIYFYRLQAGSYVITRKMMLLK